MHVVVIVRGDAQLPEFVGAGHSPCRFSCRLDGREQEDNQHADNSNDDEEFNEGKGTMRGKTADGRRQTAADASGAAALLLLSAVCCLLSAFICGVQ